MVAPVGGMHGCSRGGMHGCSGGMRGCSRGHAWLLLWGACMVALGGACMVAPRGGVHGFFDEIWSMSRQYASYWNAFLCYLLFCDP